jgi:hypothetical protein
MRLSRMRSDLPSSFLSLMSQWWLSQTPNLLSVGCDAISTLQNRDSTKLSEARDERRGSPTFAHGGWRAESAMERIQLECGVTARCCRSLFLDIGDGARGESDQLADLGQGLTLCAEIRNA